MKEVIVFVVGAASGAAAATLFTNPIRKEIATLTSTTRWLVERFHSLVTRAEAAVQKLEAKL